MKQFSVLVLLGVFFLAGAVRAQYGVPGRIVNTSTTQAQACNSMADWYTIKPSGGVPLLMSAQSGNIVVATKWGTTYVLKGFYNPRRDSSVYVTCRTTQLDTVKISIPEEGWTPKLPPIDIIFKTGTNDSIYCLFQRY
jgi:hypothetical protein